MATCLLLNQGKLNARTPWRTHSSPLGSCCGVCWLSPHFSPNHGLSMRTWIKYVTFFNEKIRSARTSSSRAQYGVAKQDTRRLDAASERDSSTYAYSYDFQRRHGQALPHLPSLLSCVKIVRLSIFDTHRIVGASDSYE